MNDATSVVLFNAIQKIDITKINGKTSLQLIGDFFYLFSTSTALGVTVSYCSCSLFFTLLLVLLNLGMFVSCSLAVWTCNSIFT